MYAPNEIGNRIKWFNNIVPWIKMHALNINNLIMLGDLNCCLKNCDRSTKTNISDKSRLALSNLIRELNLSDHWNERETGISNFTWSDGTIESRLDYIFLTKNNDLKVKKVYSEIVIDDRIGYRLTDHKAVCIEGIVNVLEKGPGYWKLNTSILKSDEYQKKIEYVIKTIKNNYNHLTAITKWELFKIMVKECSVKFSTEVAKEKKRLYMNLK